MIPECEFHSYAPDLTMSSYLFFLPFGFFELDLIFELWVLGLFSAWKLMLGICDFKFLPFCARPQILDPAPPPRLRSEEVAPSGQLR